MLVHIVWNKRRLGAPNNRDSLPTPQFQAIAFAIAALLAPAAVIAFTISFWSLAADLHWTSTFFVSTGLFSHWQVWLISAATLLVASRLLNRYAERHERLTS